jgi:thioredoxin 1
MATEITSQKQYEQEVSNSSDTVVIDFWAPWCGPCKSYKPIFDKVAEEGIDGVNFYSLDIDQEELEDVVDEFGISGVPFTAILKNGEIVADKAGLMSKADLVNFIEEAKK